MAKVRIEVLSAFAEALGIPGASEEFVPDTDAADARSIRSLLARLAAKYQYFGDMAVNRETHELTGTVAIFHNGRSLDPSNGLETNLDDGDTLTFVPVVAGG